ncbi:MAG: NepR family anti-sigma factor [Roseobacter sp.]|jgi:hypothetical protein
MARTEAQRKCEDIIDENLKRVYEEAVDEGVPDRFRVLLEALKEQERSKGTCK